MNAIVAAALRRDLNSFVRKSFQTILPGTTYLPNWHIYAIVHQLMRIHTGEVSRLLINQPPRSLKSICVSVAYTAWVLGHDPTRRIIVVSYSAELAAELHRQFRMVIDAPWYRALFPAMRPAKDTGAELVTTAGGSRYATSVGGTLTGRGADLIIIDDPLKSEEAMSDPARKRVIDWYSGTLVTRLNNKDRDAIVVVMQRLTTLPVISLARAAGSVLTCQQSPSKTASFRQGQANSTLGAPAKSCIRPGRARQCLTRSRPRSAA